MDAAIFGLACLAALNPKLLAVDLILMGNQRPRLMFTCFLLGGIGIALAIGLLDVFVLHADAIKTQGSASAGLDLGLGIPLLAVGGVLASGWEPRRRAPAPTPEAPQQRGKLNDWARRVMQQPRVGFVVAIGVVAGAPGVSYIAALHELVTGKSPAGSQVIAVLVFAIVEFALVIVPFAFMVSRPEGTERAVKRFRDWLTGHARQLAAAAALLAGGYMVISGALRLLG